MSGATDEVIDPATGAVIAEVPSGDAADIDLAVTAAVQAFPQHRAERDQALGREDARSGPSIGQPGECPC